MPEWIPFVMLLVSGLNLIGLISIWVYLDRRTTDVYALSARVSKLETSFAYLPTHQELVDIRNAISTLATETSAMRERTENSSLMLRTIQKYLTETSR